jgi:chemotaxis protein MotB
LWALLATGAAGAGGYYAWQGRDCISGKAAACEKERDTLKARSGQVESTLTQVQGNLSASKQELEALRKWKGDAAKRMQTFRDMSAKLQKMVDAGKLGVRVRDGRLVMRLPQDVLFPSGSADLSRDGELALMEVAVILRQFPDRRFMVAGHTDNQAVKETYKDNWELSMARALVVTRFLVEAKMKPQNIVAAGVSGGARSSWRGGAGRAVRGGVRRARRHPGRRGPAARPGSRPAVRGPCRRVGCR